MHDGSQSAEISIDLTFPAGIAYREGSIAFDYTPEIVNGKPSDTYAEGELERLMKDREDVKLLTSIK